MQETQESCIDEGGEGEQGGVEGGVTVLKEYAGPTRTVLVENLNFGVGERALLGALQVSHTSKLTYAHVCSRMLTYADVC
jgi:hypothetical protein